MTYATRTNLATGTNRFGRPITLTHRTAGKQPAGSLCIDVGEAWGVLWEFDGCQHGQWFNSELEARAFFDQRNVGA